MKITRLIAILLFLALPAAIAAEETDKHTPQTIRITANSQQYSFDDGLFHAQGNVCVTSGDMYINADMITGSPHTGRIEASGNVRLALEGMTLTCNLLKYTFPAAGTKTDNRFKAEGNVAIKRNTVTLEADIIEGSPSTGDVEATGRVMFKDAQRTLTGDTFKYNFNTDTGDAIGAVASIPVDSMQEDAPAPVLERESGTLYFRGQELKAEPERYQLRKSIFTTCNLEQPHYCLYAEEMIIEPGKKFTARNVAIKVIGKRLITLPYYSTKLKKSNKSAGTKFPKIGVSGDFGLYAAYTIPLADDDMNSANADLRVSTKQIIQCGIRYDKIDSKPIFARLVYKEPYYCGSQPNTMLSRLPEAGIRYCFGPSAQGYEESVDPLGISGATIDPAQFTTIVTNRGINTVVELGAGSFVEYPDKITHGRADARALVYLDAIPLDRKTFLMPGVLARTSFYDNGDNYTTAGASFAIARSLGPKSFASLTYLTQSVGGNTPFTFDKLSLANELAARLIFPSGDLSFDLAARYDLNTQSVYDFHISVSKPMHCLQPKIIWKNRAKEIGFEVGLVGF